MSTTVTVRPASTSQATGITLSGGAGSLHATLNDNSDTTFATCTDGCYGDMHMVGAALPAGAIPQAVVPRLRLHSVASGYMSVGLLPAQVTLTPLTTGTYTTIVGPTVGGFTAAQLNAGVEFVILANDNTILCSEAYLDVTYIAIPVVNVTGPTGTIGVTQPTVTWTETGDFPQSRFQVKVFSSAQYGAVGFSPDTSTPFYDSGQMTGSQRSFTPFENLPNTDSYRFYERSAQQVGSITQWSDWDFSTATVSVTPPPVPTLTVTHDNPHGRIKIRAHDAGSPTWDFVTIQRTTDGVNWMNVRSATRAATFGVNFTIYDYETGNGQPAQYRAQAIIGSGSGDIASAWSTVSAPAKWVSTDIWLKSPTLPTLNAIVLVQDIPSVTRRLPRGVFDVAGRSDPVVVSDVRKFVEGTATFVTLSATDLANLQTLLDRAEPLLLQTPIAAGWGSRYIACGDEDEARISGSALEPARLVSVPFNEVTAPVGDVINFGIAWTDVESAYATWTAVQTAQPTWQKLLQAQL